METGSASNYTTNHGLNRLGKHQRCPAIDPPLLQRRNPLRVPGFNPQEGIHVGAIARGQRNIHSTPVFRHPVAVRLIASNATARKDIILADPRNVARERIGGGCGYRIGLWMGWVSRKRCGAEDKADEARMNVSKEKLPGLGACIRNTLREGPHVSTRCRTWS